MYDGLGFAASSLKQNKCLCFISEYFRSLFCHHIRQKISKFLCLALPLTFSLFLFCAYYSLMLFYKIPCGSSQKGVDSISSCASEEQLKTEFVVEVPFMLPARYRRFDDINHLSAIIIGTFDSFYPAPVEMQQRRGDDFLPFPGLRITDIENCTFL